MVEPIRPVAGPRKRSPEEVAERLAEAQASTGRLAAEAATSVTTTVTTMAAVDDGDQIRNTTVGLPKRVYREIKRRENADDEGRGIKYWVLKGLQLQGFPVKDEDLEDKTGSFLKEVMAERRKAREG